MDRRADKAGGTPADSTALDDLTVMGRAVEKPAPPETVRADIRIEPPARTDESHAFVHRGSDGAAAGAAGGAHQAADAPAGPSRAEVIAAEPLARRQESETPSSEQPRPADSQNVRENEHRGGVAHELGGPGAPAARSASTEAAVEAPDALFAARHAQDPDGTDAAPAAQPPEAREPELRGAEEAPTEVDDQAESPAIAVAAAAGSEDSAIPLDIAAALTDLDGSETLAIIIGNVPLGAALSAGTDNGDGTWTLAAGDLAALTLTPPADFSSTVHLTVTATAMEENGGDLATATASLDIAVAAVADAPDLAVTDTAGAEDAAIPLDIAAALGDMDGSETLSIVIGGVPAGAALSAGTDNGDGTWTLEPADLSGLTVTPPADSSQDFRLTITATATEGGGDHAVATAALNVAVAGVADAPAIVLNDAAGIEDRAIPVNVSVTLGDLDGSESLLVTIGNVPPGAVLSAGTDNGDGTWTLTLAALSGLTLTPPADFSGDFQLTVTATALEGDGDAESWTGTLDVSVAGDADAPALSVSNARGTEDTVIPLDISSALADTDGSEVLSLTISGLPSGATLSAGTPGTHGTWTLTPAQLDNLTLTPPANYAGAFALTVTAHAAESDGDTAVAARTLNVTVGGDADTPKLAVSAASGAAGAPIALSIASSLVDTDGSETLSIIISGVPAGGTLSAGTDLGGGAWSLTSADLAGLTMTAPYGYGKSNSGASFTLRVTATATESDGTEATVTAALPVTVAKATIIQGGNDANVLAGGKGSDIIYGNGGADTIRGQGGHDRLMGGSHNDVLFGGNGNDTLFGGTESDTLFGDRGKDILEGGSHIDSLYGGAGDDTLVGGTETDTLDGGGGNDSLDGGSHSDVLFGGGDNDLLTGGTENDTLSGGDGRDTLSGGSHADTLYGEAGDDSLSGGTEADVMDGGTGNDVLDGGSHGDTLSGGASEDTLFGGSETDTLQGGSGNDTLSGGSHGDSLYGDGGNDTIDGGQNNDMIHGGAGNDLIYGGSTSGGADSDTIWGEDGADTYVFLAGAGNDSFHGGSGGWTDKISLVDPAAASAAGDWTLSLSSGAVLSTDAHSYSLSAHSAGTITRSDGSVLSFDGVERIEF